MNNRSAISIAGLTILLALLLSALPLQAQHQHIGNFEYIGSEWAPHVFGGEISLWIFRWDTVPNATVANTRKALFQVKGGGIFNQWVSLRLEPRNVETSGGKTTVRVSALKYNEDYALRFRIMITDADGIRHQAQMTVNWRI